MRSTGSTRPQDIPYSTPSDPRCDASVNGKEDTAFARCSACMKRIRWTLFLNHSMAAFYSFYTCTVSLLYQIVPLLTVDRKMANGETSVREFAVLTTLRHRSSSQDEFAYFGRDWICSVNHHVPPSRNYPRFLCETHLAFRFEVLLGSFTFEFGACNTISVDLWEISFILDASLTIRLSMQKRAMYNCGSHISSLMRPSKTSSLAWVLPSLQAEKAKMSSDGSTESLSDQLRSLDLSAALVEIWMNGNYLRDVFSFNVCWKG